MIVDVSVTNVVAVGGRVLLALFVVINGTYLLLTLVGFARTRSQRDFDTYDPAGLLKANQFLPEIAIVVPAYNEEAVITDSVNALLSLDYPFYDVIVVNDGSTDDTLETLLAAYDLQHIDATFPIELECEPVASIYRAPNHDLVVIDKANGGKADALNAALSFTEKSLFCAIDADSLMERGALKQVVEPFLTAPTTTVATGGTVRIANGISFERGEPEAVTLPPTRLGRFQVVEYLRAFFLGRTGLDRIGSLLIISGSFGLFRTDALRDIGGYDTTSVTEDMELVVRLHRHFIETGQDYDVTFLSYPVVWTEAPGSLAVLSRQRRRWFRGLLDTLIKHRRVFGRPAYGTIGLVAFPLFLIVETVGQLLEASGYLLISIAALASLLNPQFVLAFFLVTVGLGSFLSAIAVLGEVMTYRQYEDPLEILTLIGYGVLENISYRPWRSFVSWRALWEYATGDQSWGKMTRHGFGRDADD